MVMLITEDTKKSMGRTSRR